MQQADLDALTALMAKLRNYGGKFGLKLEPDEAALLLAAAPAMIERIRELEAAFRGVDDDFSDAVQADCENGVRWLNERAASYYLKEYPATAAAIQSAIETARAALEGAKAND